MHDVTNVEKLELIASIKDRPQRNLLISRLIEIGELTEQDIFGIMAEDMLQNLGMYIKVLQTNVGMALWISRVQDYPEIIARGLVRMWPEIFYAYGFAFRFIQKLRAILGHVLILPKNAGDLHDPAVYMADLPKHVQQDIFRLEQECRFRDYLYYMSRDSDVGFALLDEAIGAAKQDYDRRLFTGVKESCERILKMELPDFVGELRKGSPFPAFHVKWWLDSTASVDRVLNIGDTGSHKTAYAAIAVYQANCTRTLVLCTPNARTHWPSEIRSYFRDRDINKVFLIGSKTDANAIPGAPYTVVAYSTLIQEGVLEKLLAISFDSIIWDECQYGKHADGAEASQRALACARLFRELPLRKSIALSATPWENAPDEFGAAASVLRPDVFPSAAVFRRSKADDPRFLRELFAEHVIDIELREIRDLPPITPEPWKDLFGVELIDLHPWHKELYDFVRENDDVQLTSSQKVRRLLLAATHPQVLGPYYSWPADWADRFAAIELSTKLSWLLAYIRHEMAEGAKVVIGVGIHMAGITRPHPRSRGLWVGKVLREEFGHETIVTIDGTVSPHVDALGGSERQKLFDQWRFESRTRILLISAEACPDSVNLTIPKLQGITRLAVTALCLRWVPWKQFLGRFWRDGQELPVRYRVPILRGTIDENLVNFLRRKWESQQLFRAQAPLTPEETEYLQTGINNGDLARAARSKYEHVNIIAAMAKGRGEKGAEQVLAGAYGDSTNAQIFADSFIATQDYTASGHIVRCMREVIFQFQQQGILHPDGTTILDAGCGPLTIECYLGQPVYGVDFNKYIIEGARDRSSWRGINASQGYLSALQEEWDTRFELTVASLVLHWMPVISHKVGDADRSTVLAELVRVTHPQGKVWITTTEKSMNEEILVSWTDAFKAMGFVIIDDLTGLVRAKRTNPGQRSFAFWSLCFSANGNAFLNQHAEAFRFADEIPHMKRIKGGQGSKREPREHSKALCESFELVKQTGETLLISKAADVAALEEVSRLISAPNLRDWKFHRAPNLHWRVLEKLHERGLI